MRKIVSNESTRQIICVKIFGKAFKYFHISTWKLLFVSKQNEYNSTRNEEKFRKLNVLRHNFWRIIIMNSCSVLSLVTWALDFGKCHSTHIRFVLFITNLMILFILNPNVITNWESNDVKKAKETDKSVAPKIKIEGKIIYFNTRLITWLSTTTRMSTCAHHLSLRFWGWHTMPGVQSWCLWVIMKCCNISFTKSTIDHLCKWLWFDTRSMMVAHV